MKKSFLALLLVVMMVLSMNLAVSAERLTDVLGSPEVQALLAATDLGSDVFVPVDIQVDDGNGYDESHTDRSVAHDDNIHPSHMKATLDMANVRAKFLQYMNYANVLFGTTDTELMADLKNVDIKGEFHVKIKFDEEIAATVNPKLYENDVAVAGDMYGFSYESGTGNISDTFTEINPDGSAPGTKNRTWAQEMDGTGDWILTITLYPKSPNNLVAYSPLKAGDLMVKNTQAEIDALEYADLDYNTYFANIVLETGIGENITVDMTYLSGAKHTIYGTVDGHTDFVYTDEHSVTSTISNVDYISNQEVGGEDDLDPDKHPMHEDCEIIEKDTSATIELIRDGGIKLVFHVDGAYLNSPAVSGTDYTGLFDTIYDIEQICFDPGFYTTIPAPGMNPNYTFKGWSLTPGGTILVRDPMQDGIFFDQDTDVYAVFQREGGGGPSGPSSIRLNFDIEGDTTIVDAIRGSSPLKVQLDEVVVPTREGYEFDGWYTDKEMTKKANIDYETRKTTTLYGRYILRSAPPVLDSEHHFAYVIGYPEGDVRPEDNISREEVATIFSRLLKEDVRNGLMTDKNNFNDVEADRWSVRQISTMAAGGYVMGYEDSSFRPGGDITRAEFVTIAARFLEGEHAHFAGFTDIEGHWAEEYIRLAVANGWINGYEDNTFRPDSYITRAEVMAIINRILIRYVKAEDIHADTKQWIDNTPDAWYYCDVLEATNPHEYTRQADGIHETWTDIVPNYIWDIPDDWIGYEHENKIREDEKNETN